MSNGSYTVEAESTAIVLLGQFNPAIFTHWWLVHQGLLSTDDAEDVVEVTTLPRLSVFQVAWLRCEATDDRLQFSTAEPMEYDRLRDLAVGVLKTLPHVPVGAIGLNRHFHFQMATPAAWHSVGDEFVPKDFWEKHLRLPGTRSLTVEGARQDDYVGAVRVRVEPSNAVRFGVFVEYNDHYLLRHSSRQIETREEMLDPALAAEQAVQASAEHISDALAILTRNWEGSLSSAERVAKAIVSKAKK